MRDPRLVPHYAEKRQSFSRSMWVLFQFDFPGKKFWSVKCFPEPTITLFLCNVTIFYHACFHQKNFIGKTRLKSLPWGPNWGPHKLLCTNMQPRCSRGFVGGIDWVPMIPRDVSLSDSCTHDCCSYSSMVLKWEKVSISYKLFRLTDPKTKSSLFSTADRTSISHIHR